MPKTFIPFTIDYPAVLDPLILGYLEFRDLNQIVEHQQVVDEILPQEAEVLLRKANPQFINLKKAKAVGNFGALIQNIKTHIMPVICIVDIGQVVEGETEEAYQALCGIVRGQLQPLIRDEFYAFKIKHKLEVQTVRDCIYHYCQYNSNAAGQLLNQHIWKFWNSYTTDCLIEYGANVNLKFNDAAYSTLIQALRWNASAYTVRRLVEAGASYDGYQGGSEGVLYTTMLIAAFHSHIDVLEIIVEKFPDRISETLQSLNTMLDDSSGKKYSSKFGDSRTLLASNGPEKLYYEPREILAAKVNLLVAISEKHDRFILTHKDKQDILLYVQNHLKAANGFPDCLAIFDQHIQVAYLHDGNGTLYSSEKIKLIEMAQLRISEIFMENKSKKENRMNNNYYQEAQSLLSHSIFSPEHVKNGVTNRYIDQFSVYLQRFAEELKYLTARRQRFEERLQYVPGRYHVFQAASAAIIQANPLSLDSDERQISSMKKQ